MKYLAALLLAVFLACVSGCSHREVFDSEAAAKSAVLGKKSHDVMAKLGAPDSISSSGTFPDGHHYTESWKYPRTIRDPSTGDLKTFVVFFHRSFAVRVAVE
jgi:hypothetical protein